MHKVLIVQQSDIYDLLLILKTRQSAILFF